MELLNALPILGGDVLPFQSGFPTRNSSTLRYAKLVKVVGWWMLFNAWYSVMRKRFLDFSEPMRIVVSILPISNVSI